MATSQSVIGVDQVKGSSIAGSLHAYQVAVNVSGGYLTASKPNFDVLAALQAQHEGVSAVSVKSVVCFRDYNDGTNSYTAPNAQIVLSGTGNKVATFRVDSGASNGGSGSEIADATALASHFVFMVICEVTGA